MAGGDGDGDGSEAGAQLGERLAQLGAAEGLCAPEAAAGQRGEDIGLAHTRCATGSQLPIPGTAACAGAASSSVVSAVDSRRRTVNASERREGVLSCAVSS